MKNRMISWPVRTILTGSDAELTVFSHTVFMLHVIIKKAYAADKAYGGLIIVRSDRMDRKQKTDALTYMFGRSGVPFSQDVIADLANLAQEASFDKQETILGIGEKQSYLYIILQGMARSYYIDEKGNDITKLFMRENEFLIGEALFMEESLEVFEAVEPLKCLQFDAKTFKEIMMSDPVFARMYISTLESTIRYKMRREYAFQCMDATQRYLEFKKEYPKIEDRLPQNLIASYLGITKESLSRIRKKLSEN